MRGDGISGLKPDSLSRRILTFFERNPDEWLTVEDVAVKFDCTDAQARDALKFIVRTGQAERRELTMLQLVPFKLTALKGEA